MSNTPEKNDPEKCGPEKNIMTVKVGETTLIFETGQMARQANGAVVLKAGETMIFTAACSAKDAKADQDFFPLKVDYQEKFSSAGKTLGGFIKREGRPSERETLICRLIDRPLRPMFPEGYYNEVQILSYVLSYDGQHPQEPLAICCASAALEISDIPLIKPIGAVRVGMIDGKFILNPSPKQIEDSKLDLMLAGTEDAILMIEGSCEFLTESQVLEAIETGHKAIKTICHALSDWQKKVGKPKNFGTLRLVEKNLVKMMHESKGAALDHALNHKEKQKREVAIDAIKEELLTKFSSDQEPTHAPLIVKEAYDKFLAERMRNTILSTKKRVDGRGLDEIRSIYIEQHTLPRAHGSSLFTRGETQSLSVCTLGGETMAQRYEDLHGEGIQRFYLQYFFPPFSVGEVGRSGPAGRREVGHGKLAERALMYALPPKDKFPYTMRLESNIMESNGSSSMATVCGGCLALMDAGEPIKRPVSGIAMGLILEGDQFVILSDILGIEDFLGDMDFKVAGDHEGITSFQMDIKVEGITLEIMRIALDKAKAGRIHILEKMLAACPKSKAEMSQYAPRITTLQIKPSKIGTVIGPSGKMIRSIIEGTGVEIDINDDGLVSISSPNKESIDRAVSIIESLVAEIEVGRTYQGKVTSVVPFGVFVELIPGKEGLCHISEYDKERIASLEGLVKPGDTIPVKVLDINERGQLKLSRKATLV